MKKITKIAIALLLSTGIAFAGQAGDVTIDAKSGKNLNSAEGNAAMARQQVQSVNVVGDYSRVGDVTVLGKTKDSTNMARGANAKAQQQVQSVNVE